MQPHAFISTTLLVLLCSFSSIHAQETEKLQNITLPIQEKTNNGWQNAIQTAWHNIIIRITGDLDVFKKNKSTKLTDNPEQYINSFKYLSCPLRPKKTCLSIDFNLKAIKALCNELELNYWTHPRPSVLTWIFFQDNHQIKPMNNYPKLLNLYKNISELRGVHFILPLLDLQDTQAITLANTNLNLNIETIKQASKRYHINHILIANLNVTQSTGHWILLDKDNLLEWDNQSTNTQNFLTKGLNHVADNFAKEFGNNLHSPSQNLLLSIRPIHSITNLSDLIKHLANYSCLTDIQIKAMHKNAVIIQAKRIGPSTTFDEQINQDKYLSEDTEANAPLNSIALKWHPNRNNTQGRL